MPTYLSLCLKSHPLAAKLFSFSALTLLSALPHFRISHLNHLQRRYIQHVSGHVADTQQHRS